MRDKDLIYCIRRSIGLEELEQGIETKFIALQNGLKEENVYMVYKSFNKYIYFDKELAIIVPISTPEFTKARIEYLEKTFRECIEKKDFNSIISHQDGQYALLAFIALEPRIPREDLYKCFMNAYSRTDYNFANIVYELDMEGLLSLNRLKGDERKEIVDEFGEVITIYRGQGSESCELHKAISWTTSKDVAIRFATKHNLSGDGYVYSAKVSVDDITDYIKDRQEQEVIVDFDFLEDVKMEIVEGTNTECL